MNKTRKFRCGCEFEVDDDGEIIIEKDYKKLRVECQATWDLIGKGDTVGMFQIESFLGKKLARRLKPSNLTELAALISIMRPGSMEALLDDGRSVTDHFIDRKNRREKVEYLHQSLEKILSDTYGLMIFQEQTIRIGQEIAGMDEATSDKYLRKAVGKKDSELLSQCRSLFLEGCKERGIVSEETAEKIFQWILSNARYGFNKSVIGSTKIIAKDGCVKKIEDISVGEFVKTQEGYAEVKNIYDHGIQSVYSVELENRSSITCTLHHKFLCEDGEIRRLIDIFSEEHKIETWYGSSSIVKIQHMGNRPTFDIEIDNESHLFYANDGIVTSNSHAASYACTTFLTAYLKAHAPRRFFRSYLSHAKDKPKPLEEIERLAYNAKDSGIDIFCPDIRMKNADFIIHEGAIYFGLGHIKEVGETSVQELFHLIEPMKLDQMTWPEILFRVILKSKKNVAKSMIAVGCFDFLGLPRKKMLTDHDSSLKLSATELRWAHENIDFASFEDLLSVYEFILDSYENNKKNKSIATINRYNIVKGLALLLKNPTSSVEDTSEELANWERSYLGLPLSCHKVDSFEREFSSYNCGDFPKINDGEFVAITGEINAVKEHITKSKKKEMAFLAISDESGMLSSVVVFPDIWKREKGFISIGNVLNFLGKKNEDSFIVSGCKTVNQKVN